MSQYAGRPTMCRNCGALVGAGETTCSACGIPVASPPPPQSRPASSPDAHSSYDPETLRFARSVLSRPATFTFVFITFNVFIFLLMSFVGGGGGTEDAAVLMRYGAKFNSLINAGEWWRFVTPVFIHIGWLHLLVNMYSLFMLGPYVERLYGSARFVFFWVATGVAGVAASYLASSTNFHAGLLGGFLFRGGDGPSAGASGALFGLIGVLFVFGIKYRHELPDGFKRAFGLGMLPTILINLFIGYTIPFIDNAAHLGGLAAGMALALVVNYKRPGERGSVAHTWHALQIISLALVVVSFGEVWRHYDPSASLRARTPVAENPQPASDPAVDAYLLALNAGQSAYRAVVERGDAGATTGALVKIDAARGLDDESGALLKELREIVARAGEYAALDAKERAAPRVQMIKARLESDFNSWEKRSDDWIRTKGGKFRLVLKGDDDAPPDDAPPPSDEAK